MVSACDFKERCAVSVSRPAHPVAGTRTTYLTPSSNLTMYTRLYDPLSREMSWSLDDALLPEILYRTSAARAMTEGAVIDKSEPNRLRRSSSSGESDGSMLEKPPVAGGGLVEVGTLHQKLVAEVGG